MTTQRDEFMTVREAADLVGVTPAAVYSRIDSGWLSRKVTLGVVTVPRQAIETWRQEREAAARRVLAR